MNIRTKPKFVSKHAKPSVSLIKKLDEYKNLAIISSFLSYVIGFILWSFYLWDKNAGFVPVHDLNLIISGLPTALVIIFYFFYYKKYVFFKKDFYFKKKLKDKFFKKAIIYFILPYIMIHFLIKSFYEIYIFWDIIHFFVMSTFLLFIMFIDSSDRSKFDNLKYIFIIVFNIFISFMIFTLIPQEFGGAKLKWVYLDINTKQFSSQTLDYLRIDRNSSIASTNPVVILYTNSDLILIQKKPETKAITLRTRYVNSIKPVSDEELASYHNKIYKKRLKAACGLLQAPAGLSCDQFVYPPLKKPVI